MQSLKLSYCLLAGLLPKSLKQGLWSARTRNDIGIGSLQLLERMRALPPPLSLSVIPVVKLSVPHTGNCGQHSPGT